MKIRDEKITLAGIKIMARIIVTGATGFIGKALCFRLLKEGYEVIALSRSLEKGKKSLDLMSQLLNGTRKVPRDGWNTLTVLMLL